MPASTNSPSPTGSIATLANWRTAPHCHRAFHHVRELVPTARIRRGERTWELPRAMRRLDRIEFRNREGASHALGPVIAATHTDGFIALHRGRIVDERYDNGLGPDDPHLLFSVTKSLTAILAGVLEARGALDPDAPITGYVPELGASGFAGATVRHALDMRVDLDFDEDYRESGGLMVDYRVAMGWNPAPIGEPPGDLHGFLRRLTGAGRHGGPFRYVSPISDLLGWIVERAAGMRYADLMSEVLWGPMGAESDACVTVDRLGTARAAGGVCATLRDLARVGQAMLQRGVANGRAVLPGAWVDDTAAGGDAEAWRAGAFSAFLPGGRYRNQWYQVGDDLGAFIAIGIHGQYLYVAPAADVVVARLGSNPVPGDDRTDMLLIDAFGGLARALAS